MLYASVVSFISFPCSDSSVRASTVSFSLALVGPLCFWLTCASVREPALLISYFYAACILFHPFLMFCCHPTTEHCILFYRASLSTNMFRLFPLHSLDTELMNEMYAAIFLVTLVLLTRSARWRISERMVFSLAHMLLTRTLW